MPPLPDVVQLAVPLYLLAIVVEIAFGYARGWARYELRDTLTSLAMAVGSLIAGILFGFFETQALRFVQVGWGLFDWGWGFGAFALCFVLDDLRKYWLHRYQHRSRWFWAVHVVHHSSQHYNFATALRNPPTAVFSPTLVFRLPLALLGFPIEMILFVAGLNSIYQFFTHTELVGRLPWWIEAVMVTPSHHRVHHAVNARYLDANYSPVFIVWDRLFGTFVEERTDDPCRYGLVKELGTFHPVRVTLHEVVDLMRDALRPGLTLAERLRYVFSEPGYSHDGSRETTAMLRARHARVR
jgi:sterol desaturase/sphingolipid hydroxylase (fatty acid hydroxylase superfamily)